GCTVTVGNAEKGGILCRIPVETALQPKSFTGQLPAGLGEKEALYFSIEGKGGTFDFLSFDLA
ncbi:MAG: beta-xylosidase, partial [Lachnospiraceae bacterium]|nr:beta-xylosidase [Lachnospiraceae bacterium]